MQFTIGGLPAHPLIVHAVVVLIPLSALGAVAIAVRPVWNRPYAPLIGFGAVASAIAATLAMIAGNELLIAIRPTPAYGALLARHGQFGLYTTVASWVFAVLAVATWVLGRRAGGPVRAVALVSAVVGLVALVMVVIAGDLGATSVWGGLTGVAP